MVWLSGNGVTRSDKVAQRQAGLVPRWVALLEYRVLVFNQLSRPTQPGHPPWVGVVSTGSGLANAWEEMETSE